jgi:fructose-1,6-bisphosphatase I
MSAPASSSSPSADTDPLTLTRWLLADFQQYKDATGHFTMLLQSVQLAIKAISNYTRRAGISSQILANAPGTQNASGDSQAALDVIANDVFVNAVKFSGQCYIIGSEESDEPIILESASGGYAIVFDPLDGSSNISCNLSIGSIFGIYRKDPKSTQKTSVKDLLKPGRELIAAGYAVYDAATMIVLTTGNGVNGFTLDPAIGEFVLTHRNIRIPKKGKIYSINEANSLLWDKATVEYVENCKKRGCSSRYVGSMCGDIHRTLLYGGIFMYPGDKKNANGKLRLLYECNPIAMLVEQAGGKATTGTQRILDIQPKALHQRCSIFCGSPEDVYEVESLYNKYPPAPAPTNKSKL